MPRPRSPATLGGTADDVEAAFYDALQQADIARLMACWADEDDIFCVLPGSGRAVGASAIRAAFEALFAFGPVRIRPLQSCRVDALGSAVHSVIEWIDVSAAGGAQPAHGFAIHVFHKTL